MYKKIIFITIIIISIFCITGCSKKTKLTLDNYETYLYIRVDEEEDTTVYVGGVSQNFNYIDVIVEVEVTGTILKDEEERTNYYDKYKNIKKIIKVKCDIAGEGSEYIIDEDTDVYEPKFKVKSISGYVEKA